MTQRYKEEMMRLYQQSGTRQNGNSSGNINGMNQNNMNQSNMNQGSMNHNGMNHSNMNQNNMNRSNGSMNRSSTGNNGIQNDRASSADNSGNLSGTAVPNMTDASFYSNNNNGGTHVHHGHNGQNGVNVPVNCDCRFPSAESIINQMASTPSTLPLTPEDYANGVNTVSGSNAANSSNGTMTEIQPRGIGTYGIRSDTSQNVDASGIMINTAQNVGTYSVPGQSENERELSPDFVMPADIPAESSEVIPSTRNFTPSVAWVSATGDNSWGFLQFEVFTGEEGYPVQGALVTVKKKLPGGTGLARILFTNRSGLTPTIALPAPSSSFSLNPNNTTRPFSEYIVTVRASGYYSLTDINLPVFAGVKTVQPIDLIPLPSSGGIPIQPRTGTNGSTSSVG